MSSTIPMYGHSPHSSSGIYGSAEGTPDTRFTAFSPDDPRLVKANPDLPGELRSDSAHHDPFITTTIAQSQLSATAPSFSMNVPTVIAPTEPTFASSSALSESRKKLDGLVKHVKSANESSTADILGGRGEVNHNGTFSTDMDATRCIQIKAVSLSDDSIPQLVPATLKMLRKSYNLKGGERLEIGPTSAFLRYTHIEDSATVCLTLRKELPQLTVQYISPAAFAVAVQSPSKDSYSAHEGQVMLTAHLPLGTPYKKSTFEDGVRALLAVEGSLFAWQKLMATENGTFRMVAEFCDCSLAQIAVERLNGQTLNLPQGVAVVVNLELHTPDLSSPSSSHGRLSTPTRQQTGILMGSMDDVFGRMSLNNNQSRDQSSNAEPTASQAQAPTAMAYMVANAGQLGHTFGSLPAPVTGTASLMGGPYGNGQITIPQGYGAFPAMEMFYQNAGGNMNAAAQNMGTLYNSTTMVPNGYNFGVSNAGVSAPGYNQNTYGFQAPFPRQNVAGLYNDSFPFSNRGESSYHQGNQVSMRGSRQMMRGRFPNSPNPAGQHNHVDIARIRAGTDVRTTVMLRNIPNKVDQAMLKAIIDESSEGHYDFMYLRIDFSNDCNVGYAFINFTDPLDIIAFVQARSNQKWHRFKSDKVAEISYATIQGRDCLIQKFRNSSVMLEPPHYRPKLFFTHHDQNGRAGQEDVFPASDNASKLQRSCQNAENVGLFAPSAGQHLRDEQRRRRSQFDRGTSLAEREEYGFDEDHMQVGFRTSHGPFYG